MSNKHPEQRYTIVQHYLHSSDSLRKTAQRFGVSYRSVFRWVKWYQRNGAAQLYSAYHRPWNRTPRRIENKIIKLKEQTPQLTVRAAQNKLKKTGIAISLKGIWNIWKRYGYTGFNKSNMVGKFTGYCAVTSEAKKKKILARKLLESGKLSKAVAVLNSIPFLARDEIVCRVPDKLLNLQRRIEKYSLMYGKMSLSSYLTRTEKLYRLLKKKNFLFSALRIGILHTQAATWITEQEHEINLIEELKVILDKDHQYRSYILSTPLFLLLISEGISRAMLMQMDKGRAIARQCQRLLNQKKHRPPYFVQYLSTLYAHLEEYKKSALLLARSYHQLGESERKLADADLIKSFIRSGQYEQAEKMMERKGFTEAWGGASGKLRSRAILLLIRGRPQEAIANATESLDAAKHQELRSYLVQTQLLNACVYCGVNERTKAMAILKSLIPFLQRRSLKHDLKLAQVLATPCSDREKQTLRDPNILPRVKLALLLKYGNYHIACKYAEQKGIQSYLHRYILIFPDTLYSVIEKGAKTNLPEGIFQLPVFNKARIVYNISFLGAVEITRKQKLVSNKLSLKEKTFVIHLAMRAGAPGQSIFIDDLVKNFWPHSKQARRNLSHLLFHIRKKLRIPHRTLVITWRGGSARLCNCGVHFITDYTECLHTIIRARAFVRAGEWQYAKDEFLHACGLCRGRPFERMYDEWSEGLRRAFLNKMENAAEYFLEEGKKRNDYESMNTITTALADLALV